MIFGGLAGVSPPGAAAGWAEPLAPGAFSRAGAAALGDFFPARFCLGGAFLALAEVVLEDFTFGAELALFADLGGFAAAFLDDLGIPGWWRWLVPHRQASGTL